MIRALNEFWFLWILFIPVGIVAFVAAFLWGWPRVGRIAAVVVFFAIALCAIACFLPMPWQPLSGLFAIPFIFLGSKLWRRVIGSRPQMMARKPTAWIVGVGAALLVCATGLAAAFNRTEIYRIYNSPKGRYHLVVYGPAINPRRLISVMPGHGSKNVGGGFVRLYDSYGKVYGEAKVPWLYQLDSADDLRWYPWGEVATVGDDGFEIKMPKEE